MVMLGVGEICFRILDVLHAGIDLGGRRGHTGHGCVGVGEVRLRIVDVLHAGIDLGGRRGYTGHGCVGVVEIRVNNPRYTLVSNTLGAGGTLGMAWL